MGNEKKDFLFRFLPSSTRQLLKFDEEALYSTTDQLTAEKICKDILRFVPPSATITDATACIGGSSYSFAQAFQTVNAIEIDPVRFSYLQDNMRLLDVSSRVQCIFGDALAVCPTLKQDVIFLDPPWGGPEYKTMNKVALSLSGNSFAHVCRVLSQYTHYIAMKVPTNFDEELFLQDVCSDMKLIFRNVNLRKMHLLVFKSKASTVT